MDKEVKEKKVRKKEKGKKKVNILVRNVIKEMITKVFHSQLTSTSI